MIIRAEWVVPVTAPPIRDGFVEIEAGRIVAVGPAARLGGRPIARDFGRAIITPGLVNPHTHLELTAYAGRLEPAPFWPWIQELVQLRLQAGRREREEQGALEGAWQSLRAGVTCIGDISRENVAWRALKAAPIRKVCFVELLSLADQPPRDPDELRAAVAEVAEDDLLTVGITPHAPYTVPGEHIRAAVTLAQELNRPWCTHWAETPEEVAFLAGDLSGIPWFLRILLSQCGVASPACTPLEYLDRCAGGLPPGLLAHMNYVADGEIERLAAAGHSVVYCPRAHSFFGHAAHPFHRLIAAGVNVAIGTDSAASNQSLSVLAELRFIRRNLENPRPPDELLRMATLNGARALGLAEQIGSLEPGKAADLAVFPCAAGTDDPALELVERAPAPVSVRVAGRVVCECKMQNAK